MERKHLSRLQAERLAIVMLRLVVENNSKLVRGRKRARENIERYCLEPYGMKRRESGNYRGDEELDKTVHYLLAKIS